MNPSKVRMLSEDEKSYEMHDGQSPFRVPKAGLSEGLHQKIRAMARGGAVHAANGAMMSDPAQMASLPLQSFSTQPAVDPQVAAQQALEAERAKAYPWLSDPKRMAELEADQGRAAATFDNAAAHPLSTIDSGIGDLIPGYNNVRAANNELQTSLRKSGEALAARPPTVAPGPKPDEKAGVPPPEVAPPSVMQAPRIGGGDGSAKERNQAYEDEKAAAMAVGSAKEEAARQEARALGAKTQEMQLIQLKENDLQQRSMADADARMAKVQQARDEMAKLDTTIDPGRFWANQSTAGKLVGIIGLALGAAGSGNDGVNRAAGMLNSLIDKDIDIQKAEHDMAFKKGVNNLDSAQSMYSMGRAAFQDQTAALASAKATAYAIAENKVKEVMAGVQGPIEKAQGAQLMAQIGEKKLAADQAARSAATEAAYKNAMVKLEQAKVGVALQKGTTSPEELKQLHAGEAAAQNSLDYIKDIREGLAKTNSWIPGKTALNQNFGEDAARLDAARTALVLELKDVKHLGQIGPADKMLLESIIADPSAVFTREGVKQAKLDELEKVVLRSILNQRASVRGGQAQKAPGQAN